MNFGNNKKVKEIVIDHEFNSFSYRVASTKKMRTPSLSKALNIVAEAQMHTSMLERQGLQGIDTFTCYHCPDICYNVQNLTKKNIIYFILAEVV